MNINGEYPGSRLKRLRVDGDSLLEQNVTIGGDLVVNGTVHFPIVIPDKIYVDDGTESLPSYSFSEEKSLGLARTAAGEVSICSGGSKRLRITDTTTEVVGSLTAGTLAATHSSLSGTAPLSLTSLSGTTDIYSFGPQTRFLVGTAGTPVFTLAPTQVSIGPDTYVGAKLEVEDSCVVPKYTFPGESEGKSYIDYDDIGAYIRIYANTVECARFQSSTIYGTNLNLTGTLTGNSGSFTGGLTTTSLVSTGACTLGAVTASSLTTSGVASVGSLSTVSISSTGPAALGAMTASSVTSSTSITGNNLSCSAQMLTTFAVTASTAISTSSFTLFNGWSTTPAISRGTAPVTVSGSQFTIHATGYYDIGFQIMWAANATGQRSATMRINGAPTNFAYDIRNAVTGGFVTSNMGSMKRYLSSGDYVEVEVWQNSGGSLNIQNNGNQIAGINFIQMC